MCFGLKFWVYSVLWICITTTIMAENVIVPVNVPPSWIIKPTDKAFTQDSDAEVQCEADGFPKPQITWRRTEGNKPGEHTDMKLNDTNIEVKDGTLFITNINKSNEGYYLCKAVNGIGTGISALISVSVQAPVRFEVSDHRTQTARYNEPMFLRCLLVDIEKPFEIFWNMNNKRLDLQNNSRYMIQEENFDRGFFSNLYINKTKREDSALFTCVATNDKGSYYTHINLTIIDVPEAPYDLEVLDKFSRSVQLSWVAPYDGNSPIKNYFIEYKESTGTWEKDTVFHGTTTEAKVFDLHPATVYHFRIVAENTLGISQPSNIVSVITDQEAPSASPVDIKVAALDQNTLKVTWKPPPIQNCNGDIKMYYVGYKLTTLTDRPYIFEAVDISKETGTEYQLQIENLEMYTQYSIVVQASNKIGLSPISEEIKIYTAEGIPNAPPGDVFCKSLTAQTIQISWVSPPIASANGMIKGYTVIYGPTETQYDDKTKNTKITSTNKIILRGLMKYTNYSIEVSATTSGGDGVRSIPIHCQTEEDVPEAPSAAKALIESSKSILVSWKAPGQPNGIISHYTVYTQMQGFESVSNRVSPSQLSYLATELNTTRYNFWVTASTVVGESEPSPIVSNTPDTQVPAKISSFDDLFVATYKKNIQLPCEAVGIPPLNIIWKIKGSPLVTSERVRQLPEGSLLINDVKREDAGNYTCRIENQFGADSVTHNLTVRAPPLFPVVTLSSSTESSITLKLEPIDNTPIKGYTILYNHEFGEWQMVQIANQLFHTLENLYCGSTYQILISVFNDIGTNETALIAQTKGSKPIAPKATDFMKIAKESLTLKLDKWQDGGCRIIYYLIENKIKGSKYWNNISNSIGPGGNFVVLDLSPATQYLLKVTANSYAGSTAAEYEYTTTI